MEKSKVFKYIFNMVFLFFLIWLTFYILLREQNMGKLLIIIRNAKLPYVFLGFLCMFVFYFCESINMRRTLVALGENCNLPSALKYTLIGIFFSGITPAATGGQPMQVYYMHKDGIKVSSSTIALVLNLFSFQTVTILLALISFLFLNSMLEPWIIILFITGLLLNSFSLALVLIGLFSKKLSAALILYVTKILKLLRVKNYEDKEKKLYESLERYNESAKYIRSNKDILKKQFLFAIIQQILYYSIPFFVLYALGFSNQNYVFILALQSMVFAMASGIPLPGAVGVSESAFVSVYKSIFTEDYINAAMILSRSISFYLPMIICAIVVIYATIKTRKDNNSILSSNKYKI